MIILNLRVFRHVFAQSQQVKLCKYKMRDCSWGAPKCGFPNMDAEGAIRPALAGRTYDEKPLKRSYVMPTNPAPQRTVVQDRAVVLARTARNSIHPRSNNYSSKRAVYAKIIPAQPRPERFSAEFTSSVCVPRDIHCCPAVPICTLVRCSRQFFNDAAASDSCVQRLIVDLHNHAVPASSWTRQLAPTGPPYNPAWPRRAPHNRS